MIASGRSTTYPRTRRSGAAEMEVYDPNCEFADPFVSFNGVDRFKENLSNFGKVTCALLAFHCVAYHDDTKALRISH